MTDPPFASVDVAAAFAAFPTPERDGLLALRRLVFATAQDTPDAGTLNETLKWRQPAYVTEAPRTGTTIRLGLTRLDGFALFVHCQTTILQEFRSLFPGGFDYQGNRGLRFAVGESLPERRLRLVIARALTYRLKPAASKKGAGH